MNELLKEFESMKEQMSMAEIDLTKFVNGAKGSKSASVRVRKNMMKIKQSAQNIRTLISRIKNEGTYRREE